MTHRYEVCPEEALPPGERTIVDADGVSVGVFNVDGEFYALANACPHQLAELCRGQIGGHVTAPEVGEYETERDGQIIRCPRHRWAFDIKTGESVFNPHVRARTFDVDTEAASDRDDGDRQVERYGTALRGEEPPIETYDVEVEDEVVVLYA